MELNRKNRSRLRLQSLGFAVLFLAAVGLLAWLSTRYHAQADWTAGGRHSLSEASTGVLDKLDGAVRITAFARTEEVSGSRRQISDFVSRYQRHKPDLQLEFVNPDLAPDRVRELGISLEGELVVEYAGRRENVRNITEESLTNTLQRLARSSERRLIFVQGHGERRPRGDANHDLSAWTRQLETQGFRLGELNLAAAPEIPADTSVLVIASPDNDFLPGETALLRDFVEQGGSLLWLLEPKGLRGLAPLADTLGITLVPGVVVDPTAEMLGINHPAFAVVADYPPHAITENLGSVTLFPIAASLRTEEREGWQTEPLLRTVPRSWAETSELAGVLAFDADQDREGPLTVGVTLLRERQSDQGLASQRVAVIGDGDFLSNAYLGNGANLELGNRVLNWLAHDDSFISLPTRIAADNQLTLTPTLSALLGFGFLLVIPGMLLGAGVLIWFRRRRR